MDNNLRSFNKEVRHQQETSSKKKQWNNKLNVNLILWEEEK
jgi:hypothetical protein